MTKTEIHSAQALREHLRAAQLDWSQTVLQGIDLRATDLDRTLQGEDLAHGVFLGCPMSAVLALQATRQGALVFSQPDALPFEPYRPRLYDAGSLLEGFDPARPETYRVTPDWRTYLQAMDPTTHRRRVDVAIDAVLFQRLHDLSMTEALDDLLRSPAAAAAQPQPGGTPVVGIMGGHDRARCLQVGAEPSPYLQVARLARSLSRRGFTVATGGGPGSMEAANLGAWFADRPEAEMHAAIEHLSSVPVIRKGSPGLWLAPAFEVMARYPRRAGDPRTDSIGIPTWFYGHEPPNPFASHIAKFFDNSLREEGLLAIANGGVVFTEGNGGTVQEIFQDACQNYYSTYGHQAPMVLLGKRYWNRGSEGTAARRDKPAWPLLQQLGAEKGFADRLKLTDSNQDAVLFLTQWARRAGVLRDEVQR